MSSLAAQLAKNASLNATLYADRSRRKPAFSYLFTGRDADQYDLETIHALGQNALIQLSSVEPALEPYEDALFSDQAKATDRTLLTVDANEELDRSISEFLSLLGPYLMEPPTGKVIEWLVRRFRINEFNIDAIMTLFLPYHETPHFTKMVSILQIKPNTLWSFLAPYKSAAQNIQRVSLVSEMLRNGDLTRFVTSLLPNAVKEGHAYRTLLAFNAATLHEFIKRSKALDEGTVACLLPAFLEPLQQKSEAPSKDAILGSYILLAALSQKCDIAAPALKVILGSMASAAHHVSTPQFVSAAVAVCQAQTELERVSQSTMNSVLKLKGINEEMTAACKWQGSEKFFLPLVTRLYPKLSETDVSEFLENLVAPPSIPDAVLVRLTTLLLKDIVSGGTALRQRQFLSALQQRHPDTVRAVAKALSEEDDETKETIEQLIMSLSMTKDIPSNTNSAPSVDLIVASTHADPNVRCIAVKKLLSLSKIDSTDSEELKSIHTALIGRVSDSNVEVVEALYEEPGALAPIFISNSIDYVDALAGSIASPSAKPKRAVLRLHLGFLAGHVLSDVPPSVQEDIFNRVLFPFLLFSKARQHTAELVWETISQIIQDAPAASAFELLKGCPELLHRDEGTETTVDNMISFNSAISSKIAENIIRSDNFAKHLEGVTAKLVDENPYTRAFAFLVVGTLLGRLSDGHQIKACHKVLEILSLEQLAGVGDLAEGQELEEVLKPDVIGRLVVVKPCSKTTLSWLQVAVTAAIANTSEPTNQLIDWFKDADKMSADTRDLYANLARKIYKLVNASHSLLGLSMGLLQVLFAGLKDDVLVFLAGMWTSADEEYVHLQTVALLHATALLEAHVQEEDGIDFQTILPSLLAMLQSTDPQNRLAALESISRLRIIAGTKLREVYKFDVVYEQKNQHLQYLDQDDLLRYLDALVDHRDHFSNDSTYLSVFHGHYLVKNSGEKKRDFEYRQRVLCCLLSHINALPSPAVQVALLRSIHQVADKAKLELLLPSIQKLLLPNEVHGEDLSSALLSVFNVSAAKDLNEEGQPFWKIYVDLIRRHFTIDSPESLRSVLIAGLEQGLYGKLTQNRQIAICNLILEICSGDPSLQKSGKGLLFNILNDIPVIISLLSSLAPGSNAGRRASKRVKTAESEEYSTARLSFLAEILAAKALPGSIELISHLLEALGNVIQSLSSSQGDVNYVEQLLMSAIESAASRVVEIPNLSPSAIRLDVLVELIRVTENPQTFHQALLLMANLTRLAPESVLHNVMPVFTFMGSNVFHRDDAYSFNVVQKTIDGIVPVMVASLQSSYSTPLELIIGAKEFLHLFTDAVNHIPRHRRTKFFSHLVAVLGPDHFLAPVCMLLVEKVVNRVVRQPDEEVHGSLALPLALLANSLLPIRVQAIAEILDESHRLASRAIHPEETSPIFLNDASDDQTVLSTICRRRAQALILFVGLAFDAPLSKDLTAGVALSDVVRKLISLAVLETNEGHGKLRDLSQAGRNSLNRLLNVMSAMDFVDSTSSMLETEDQEIQSGALDLLSQRLPNLTSKARQEAAVTVVRMVPALKNIIARKTVAPILPSALKALKSIASTMEAREQAALAEVVPIVLDATLRPEVSSDAWNALLPLSNKLGPRIIPHFRPIVQGCVVALRSDDSPSAPVIYSTLQGLLSSIPTFWTMAEVTSLFTLYIGQGTRAPAMASLIKSLTKRLSSKILIPALLELWKPLQQTMDMTRMATFLELLSRTLHNADRPSVLEHLRPTFKLFLEALSSAAPGHQMETEVIKAFRELVVKLNETAFRPLFRRLYDWAFASDEENLQHKLVFIHLYMGLQDYFKSLMSPYMSLLLTPFTEILDKYSTSEQEDGMLWSSTLSSLLRSLTLDDGSSGGFWRDDKLRQISKALVQQVDVCIKSDFPEGKQLLQDCLVALVEAVTDDTLLKTINLNVLMHTRSEDARVRLYALSCSEGLWRAHGGRLLGFVSETATFIAECSEDENDMVVKESFRLKDAVESIAGKVDGL